MKAIIIIALAIGLVKVLGDLIADNLRAKRIHEKSRGMIYTKKD